MSVSLWQDRSANKVQNYDITIIGGGIAGLSAAYWITKEDPTLKVALVEKGVIGSGASGRNAGFITCGSVEHFNRLVEKHGAEEALEMWHFSEINLELLKEEIIQDKAQELLFEHNGSFSLASEVNEFAELKNAAALMESMHIDVEILNQFEIEKRLNVIDFVGGIKYKKDASIHPIKLLDQLCHELSGKVDILENHEVFAIDQQGDNKLIKTNRAHFSSPLVVLATNGYSPLIHQFFADKIFPTRGQVLAVGPVEKFMEGPCYANFVLDYFRQLPTGELVIGGFRQLQKDVEKGYSDEISDEIQNALESFVRRHIPKLAKAPVTHRWSGIMGFSVDGQPMVGSLKTDPQIFFLGGFTAHGIGLAFHAGKCLTDAIFGRPIPKFLSAQRF